MPTSVFATTSDFRFLVAYPDARVAAAALVLMTRDERRGFVRSWLSEGIPAVFRERPMMYEMIREWVARRFSVSPIRVDPKEITLIGSARFGYSLAPRPEFGRPFGSHSDFDFSAVSSELFDAVCKDSRCWREDLENKSVLPRTEKERKLWPENIAVIANHIGRGFVDPYKIPNRYPTVRRLNSTMQELQWQLLSAHGAPKIRSSSVRIFRDWESFVSQACLNLNSAVPRQAKLSASFFGSDYWDWTEI